MRINRLSFAMAPDTQMIVALVVVALAAAYLLRQALRQRRGGEGCGCPPDKFKRSLKR